MIEDDMRQLAQQLLAKLADRVVRLDQTFAVAAFAELTQRAVLLFDELSRRTGALEK